MLKELNQIKNQRYGFVRVKLLVSYWDKLSLIREMELDYFTDEEGRKKQVGVLAKGWDHAGSYIQLLYVINHPLGYYEFLMGEVNKEIQQYQYFSLKLEESLLLNQSLIDYLVEKARRISI